MNTARTLMVRVMLRIQDALHPTQRDRGDLPAKAIIYAGMAVLALALVTWATTYINGYLNTAPGAAPAKP